MNSRTLLEKRIRQTRLFLLDLDGTIYRGATLIPGAKNFIEHLRKNRVPYVFLTNNSSMGASDYVKKITGLGIPAGRENIFTSGQATGFYLSRKKRGLRVFVVGTAALAKELARYGCTTVDGSGAVDFVVVGFDTELTYKKIRIAGEHIDRGAGYIATNPDYVCPVESGRSIPDCGSICFMIEQATGKKPYVIGKPRPEMVKLICRRNGVAFAKTALIGDRLYTDIAAGRNAGVFTVCVLSGESTRNDIARSSVKPDGIIESVNTLNLFFASGKP
jgi:4-nitrophenyl phosphatase